MDNGWSRLTQRLLKLKITERKAKWLFAISLIALSIIHYPLSLIHANDCTGFKTIPPVNITIPEHEIFIAQPDGFSDLLHGRVLATFSEQFEISYGVGEANGGWCLFIERIDATMGYTEFTVEIDQRHIKGSCEYDAILEHEFEHVAAHLSVITDEKPRIKQAVTNAAASILPVLIEYQSQIEGAMDRLEKHLQERPEIRLMRQKLAAEREIRNRKIDLEDRGWRIERCKL